MIGNCSCWTNFWRQWCCQNWAFEEDIYPIVRNFAPQMEWPDKYIYVYSLFMFIILYIPFCSRKFMGLNFSVSDILKGIGTSAPPGPWTDFVPWPQESDCKFSCHQLRGIEISYKSFGISQHWNWIYVAVDFVYHFFRCENWGDIWLLSSPLHMRSAANINIWNWIDWRSPYRNWVTCC